MKYGCIGEHLKHSFSKEIHNALCSYEYELCEVKAEELSDFLSGGDFLGINVTIPYKEKVISHLHYIDDAARHIGAVNTVVNRDGKLYGYNTDAYGMTELIRHAGIDLSGKKVAILGTGGTSKTARYVATKLGAAEILTVSRSKKEDAISYSELYKLHTDCDIIINTTPSGMFPGGYEKPISLEAFHALSGVVDVVYNPLVTPLVREAIENNIPAVGGLYMLVAQAARTAEIFTDTRFPESTVGEIYKDILGKKKNIVLIGMPSSGKTTVGKILAQKLSRNLYDTDLMVEAEACRKIPELFSIIGEEGFRELEANEVAEASSYLGVVIATGGGAVLRKKNIFALKQNGKIYFLDRPKELLCPTEDRPLSKNREAMEKRFSERYPIYMAAADCTVDCDRSPEEIAEYIIADFYK